MDINLFKNTNKYEFFWLDPQSQKIVGIRYIQPWGLSDFITLANDNKSSFNSIDYPFAIFHDYSLFPSRETSAGSIHDNLRGKSLYLPSNLKLIVVFNPNKNIISEIAYDIVEHAIFRRQITHFVTSIEAATELLSKNGFNILDSK